MSDDEDDKPTDVLDINALKEEMEKKKDEMSEIASELSFGATTKDDDSSSNTSAEDLEALIEDETEEEQQQNRPVILFDFNSDFFAKNVSKLPQEFDFKVVSELKDLNILMQAEGEKVVIFNYNAAAKAVNQLTVQIKAKFPNVKTIIMAKNLSDEKAQQHKNTKSGAHGYLSIPFKKNLFIEVVKKV